MSVLALPPYIRNRYALRMQGKYPPNRIAEIRKEHEVSQGQLAALCVPPTTAPTIEKLENLKMELTYTWMVRLGEALGVHPAEFMSQTPRPLPNEREAAVLGVFRGLSVPAQRAAYRILNTIEEPGEDKQVG
jgi:transcriptional regulator with XRE-family HTH domain